MGRVLAPLRRRFTNDTKGEAVFPLAVLSALYFFDEFDTAAFATLAPDIKRSFGLTDERFLSLVIINISLIVLLAIPVGYLADRVSRVRLVVLSGVLAGSFSLMTGLATTTLLLGMARFGNGVGLLANSPIHNSLIADYYTPAARPTSYANHTNAMYVGAIIGPGFAGVAGFIFGWRAAFMVLFVPILICTIVAARLQEPARGGTDGTAEHEAPPRFRDACQTLWAVRTLRRIFWASVPLGAGIIPLVAYVSLYFEREFGVGQLGRGLIGAANAACTYVGVQRGGRATPGWLAKGMGVPLQKIGLVFAGVGVGLVVFAATPWLLVAVIVGLPVNFIIGYFFAPLYAVQALVSPARERTLSFSLSSIFLVAGVVVFFLLGLGSVADDHGLRVAIAVLAPFFLISGAMAASAGRFVQHDVAKAFAPD
jgi:branched-chain amino acid transport system ATP-binding protein